MSLSRTVWGWVFLGKGVYNIAVSLVLLIWADSLLPLMGSPAGNPVYPQMFLLLCLAFGIGYAIVGLDVDSNAGIVTIGILGQLSVFAVVIWQWRAGAVYGPAVLSGVIDLGFALLFAVFLWTHKYPIARA
jgi:hypothetical protein